MDGSPKREAYRGVMRTVEALIEGEEDLIAVMSTISCELVEFAVEVVDVV